MIEQRDTTNPQSKIQNRITPSIQFIYALCSLIWTSAFPLPNSPPLHHSNISMSPALYSIITTSTFPLPNSPSLPQSDTFSQAMVPETYTVSQTNIIGTGRNQPLIHPVMAEVALLCDIFFIIKSDGVIGAFWNAGLTPGT